MQQIKRVRASELRDKFKTHSWSVLGGKPIEVTSYGQPVAVLVLGSSVALPNGCPEITKAELRRSARSCYDGLLQGVNAYKVTYHGRLHMALLSPKFAKESGVYEL